MRKSDYASAREGYWKAKDNGGDYIRYWTPREIEEFVARDIEAAESAGVTWDQEPELPASLEFRDFGRFGPRVVTGDAEATWVAVTPPDTAAMVPGRETAFKGAVLRAMVAAYNREREEERTEAEVGPILDEGIPRLLEMEIAKEVEKAVHARVNTAVRELLFLSAIEGIRSLSRGGKGCVFRAVEALRPDIAAEWKEEGDDGSGVLRKYFPDPDAVRREPTEVEQLIRQKVNLQEALRVAEREREEIEQEAESMRVRINRGADYMRQNWPVTLAKWADGVKQGVILGLYRILTGKES